MVGSTRKGAISLDRSRNPIVLCALHPLCLSRRNTFDFLRDLNDASILDLNLSEGVMDPAFGIQRNSPLFLDDLLALVLLQYVEDSQNTRR